MKHTDISSLFKSPQLFCGTELTVSGWIRTVRDSKRFGFAEVNDGSCFKNLQLVLERDMLDNYDEIIHTGVGSAICATGILTATPQAQQPFELSVNRITVTGPCAPDYPLQKKRHSFEFLRTLPHLRQRTNSLSAAYRMRSLASFAIHRFFQERGFIYMHTPILTASDCEGAGEMFQVTTLDPGCPPRTADGAVDYSKDFFGKKVSLTVSGQLMGESAALAFGKIYTFGPTFRAEKSYTSRHAAEFWMIEPEVAFCDLEGDMELAESMIRYVISYCMENAPDELEFFNRYMDNGLIERLNGIISAERFRRISYTEAVELLSRSGKSFEFPVFWGCDLATEHERYLTEEIFGSPVFVTDYPKEIKAFYMKQNPDGKTVAAADLLVPGIGEIIGGSQREDDAEKLRARMEELEMDPEAYRWYLDLRRFGGAEHSGFGLGFERLLMYITGIANIRDILPFPRTTGNCEL